MAKYRRLEEPEDEVTYAEEFQQTHGEAPAANPEEETFKTLYTKTTPMRGQQPVQSISIKSIQVSGKRLTRSLRLKL